MSKLFHRELFTSPKTTWAVGQLSQSSSNALTKNIDRDSVKTVIEYWPGWGNITQAILDKLPTDGQLICFEINKKDFKPHLDKIQDPRLIIYYSWCENLSAYCDANSVDIIISTIPLSLMPKTTVTTIISQSFTALKSWGKFITGQYSTYAKKFMTPVFAHTEHRRHLRNLPPVCIITSIKTMDNL